jgi:hypothetical protein
MKVMATIRWSFPCPKEVLWPLRHGKVPEVPGSHSS